MGTAGGDHHRRDGAVAGKRAGQAGAAEISAATGSPVHVVYVMPTESRLYGHHSYSEDVKKSLLEEAKTEARKFLDGRAEGVRSSGGDVAQTYLGTGRPDEEIVELAEEIDAGLVVLGSRGLGGVRRALVLLRSLAPIRPKNLLSKNLELIIEHEYYEEAVINAFKAVESRLRYVLNKRGTQVEALIREAFNAEAGTLHDPKDNKAEREGTFLWFKGTFQRFRNCRAHGFVDTDAEEAFDLIVMANRICSPSKRAPNTANHR